MKENKRLSNDSTHILNISQDLSNIPNTKLGNSQKNELIIEELLDRNKVSREIFFICKNCDGPLIQHTFCRICKKTASRICTKCGSIKTVGDHNQCFRMMLLGYSKKDLK